MKLLRELKEFKAEAYVLIGNGPDDIKFLSHMSEKFNGKEKYLWYPGEPKGSKRTGLAALNVLPHTILKWRFKNFLFLVDREHFKKANEEQDTIQEYLQKRRLTITNTFTLTSKSTFILSGSHYNQSFNLCAVIFGIKINIEEEISQLIKEVYGIQLEPQKDVIERFLRSRRIDLKSIIESARMEQLERAFPGLCNALKWIEHKG